MTFLIVAAIIPALPHPFIDLATANSQAYRIALGLRAKADERTWTIDADSAFGHFAESRSAGVTAHDG